MNTNNRNRNYSYWRIFIVLLFLVIILLDLNGAEQVAEKEDLKPMQANSNSQTQEQKAQVEPTINLNEFVNQMTERDKKRFLKKTEEIRKETLEKTSNMIYEKILGLKKKIQRGVRRIRSSLVDHDEL